MSEKQGSRLPCLRLHQLHHVGAEHAVTPLSFHAATDALHSNHQEESSLVVSLQPPGLRISDPTSGEDVFYLPLLFAETELKFLAHRVDQPVIILKHGMVLRHATPRATENPGGAGRVKAELREDEGQFWLIVVDGDKEDAKRVLDACGAAGTICRRERSAFDLEEETLGTGARVMLHKTRRSCYPNDPDDSAVLKIMKTPGDEKLLRALCSEVALLVASQGHPNIVKFRGLFCLNADLHSKPSCPPEFAIMMQYCSGGDLFTIAQKEALSECQAKQVMTRLFSALTHLHQRGLVHRDVKPENVLLDEGGQPMLIDFGIAARLSDKHEMCRKCGSPGYVAPEVLLGYSCGIEVDSFGAGALLYFILCQRPPFMGSSIPTTISRSISSPVKFKKPAFQNVQLECILMIQALLHKSPQRRLTAEAALADPWIMSTVAEHSMAEASRAASELLSSAADAAFAQPLAQVQCSGPDDSSVATSACSPTEEE